MAIIRYNAVTAFFMVSLLLTAGRNSLAQMADKPTYTPDGVVHVRAFDLPPSSYLSPEAVETYKARADHPLPNAFAGSSIEDMRAATERMLAPMVTASQQRYPVNVAEQEISGVKTHVITPKGGEINPHRVLINVHGGAFMMCAYGCAMVESIPIAAVGRF